MFHKTTMTDQNMKVYHFLVFAFKIRKIPLIFFRVRIDNDKILVIVKVRNAGLLSPSLKVELI